MGRNRKSENGARPHFNPILMSPFFSNGQNIRKSVYPLFSRVWGCFQQAAFINDFLKEKIEYSIFPKG